jgi:CBS domain-containing protein
MSEFELCRGKMMAEQKVLESRVSRAQSEYPAHQRVPRLTIGSLLKERNLGLPCIDSSFRSVDALRLLGEKSLEAVVVLDAGRMVGVFSLQDFALATIGAGLSAMPMPVTEVMTPCKCQVSPDDSAQTCLNLLDENHLNFMPVFDAGKLIALLPREALLREIVSNYEKIFREFALDQQILFLRGTYSC